MISRAAHKHLFYMEMAKLLEAGFDIRKAAAVLLDTRLPAPQAALLEGMNRGLESGDSITAAFSRGDLTEIERAIIGAGERGGNLAPAFAHLAGYFGMVASSRREIVRGMIYPVIILHLGIVIATVPMGLMLGESSPGELLGDFLLALLGTYAAAAVLFLLIRTLLRATVANPRLDRAINRIPWIGAARRSMAMARFCKVYHSCLLAGISMTETVRLASGASHSGTIRQAGAELEATARDGQPLGPRFMALSAFPKTFARSYATGEEAGTLDSDLARWSALFQSDAESGARTVAVMVPKVLYFLILGYVGWQVVGFYNSYYGEMFKMLEE